MFSFYNKLYKFEHPAFIITLSFLDSLGNYLCLFSITITVIKTLFIPCVLNVQFV